MKTLAFWKTVVNERGDFLDRLLAELDQLSIPYCVVGGQAVNAYVEPLVSVREVLGMKLPEAALEDVLQGKIWAALDDARRPSKRQKDLADIARIIESRPHLRDRVPAEILARLV
jgi:hypothetical protein